MRKFLYFILTVIMICSIAVVGASCFGDEGSSSENQKESSSVLPDYTVEYAQYSALEVSELFKGNDSVVNVKLYAPSGAVVTLGNGTVVLDECGSYRFVHSNGEVTEIVVADTNPPTMNFSGSFNDVYKGDIVTLPVLEIFNSDGSVVEDYSVTVTFEGNEIEVVDGAFVAVRTGEYTVYYECVGKNGLKAERTFVFNCLMRETYVFAVGTEITLTDEFFDRSIDGGEYTTSFEVTKVTKTQKTAVEGVTFVLDEISYYEVVGTAVNVADETDVVTVKALYYSDKVNINTYENGSRHAVYPNGAAMTEIRDFNGDSARVLSGKGEGEYHLELLIENLPKINYTMYFDLSYVGSVSDGWLCQLGWDAGDIVYGKGRYSLNITVTVDGLYHQTFLTVAPAFQTGNESLIVIDNIVFEPAKAPTVTVENEGIVLGEEVEEFTLNAENLGLSAVDALDNEVNNYVINSVLFTSTTGTEEVEIAFGETLQIQEGYYTVNLKAVDKWSNSTEKTITLYVGNVDYYAPEIVAEAIDISKAVGSEVALNAEGLGLTITDNEELAEVTYSVVKVEKTTRTDLGQVESFTVELGCYYKVTVTATDAKGNVAVENLIVKDTNLIMLTFNNDRDTLVGDRLSFKKLNDGNNGYMKLQVSDWTYPAILIPKSLIQPAQYDIYIETEFYGDIFEWTLQLANGLIFGKDAGVWKLENAYATGDGEYTAYMFMTGNAGVLVGANYMTIDNMVFIPKGAPVIEVENAEIEVESGSLDGTTLNAENLGLTATDMFGTTLTNYAFTKVEYTSAEGTVELDIAFGATVDTVADGMYVFTVKVTDAWGNASEKTITVYVGGSDFFAPEFAGATDVSKEVGAEVVLSAEGLGLTITDNVGVVSTTYAVIKVSGRTKTELTDITSFVVEAGCYYEIVVTASDEAGNSASRYVLVKDSNIIMLTFNNATDRMDGSRFSFTKASEGVNGYYKVQATDWNYGEWFIPANVITVGRYDVYVDITFVGSNWEWTFQFGDGTMISNNDGIWKIGTSYATGDGAYSAIGFAAANAGNLTGSNYARIDNIVLIPKTNPTINVANPEIEVESGSLDGTTLNAENLGLTATDVFGTALTSYAFTKVEYTSAEGTVELDVAFGATVETVADGIYVFTVSVTDAWGNTKEVTITVFVGSADFSAPEIVATATDIAKEVGAEVVLSAEGLGLTITDNVGVVSTTYAITKVNGTEKTELTDITSFVVESGCYYEIVVTASDEAGNTASRYLLVKDSAILIITFNNSETLAGSRYVCGKAYDGANGYATIYATDYNYTELLIPSSLVPAGSYEVYVEFTFVGSNWDWCFENHDGSIMYATNGVFKLYGNTYSVGDYSAYNFKTVNAGTLNGSNYLIIDNIVLVPKA